MHWIMPVFAVALALLFGAILVGVLGWRHPQRPETGPSLLFTILLLFPLIWAAAIWLTPMGPPVMGVTLLPALLAGLLIALLIAMFSHPLPGSAGTTAAESAAADTAATVFGVVFWLLMLMAAGAIIAGFVLDAS